MAKRHGWSEDQIANLADFRTRADFSEAEKLALTLAELETQRPHDVGDELWAALKQHYSDGEIIELAAAIGLFNYFNRFNDVLKMEPTK